MALKKSAESAGSAKKAAPKKAASAETATKKAAPKKAAGAATATKKAAPKKAAGPKLSEPQHLMLKRVSEAGETGYRAEKKPENKTLETLLKHKLVKKGKKHQESGNYHFSISKAGEKHLATAPAPTPKGS